VRMSRSRAHVLSGLGQAVRGIRRATTLTDIPCIKTITVSPDVDVGSPPFVPVTRKSGVKITAVVDGTGLKLVCKDFPISDKGRFEFRIACLLSDDDKKSGTTLFASVVGACMSSYEGGFAMCSVRAMCSWAQSTRCPRAYDRVLDRALGHDRNPVRVVQRHICHGQNAPPRLRS